MKNWNSPFYVWEGFNRSSIIVSALLASTLAFFKALTAADGKEPLFGFCGVEAFV